MVTGLLFTLKSPYLAPKMFFLLVLYEFSDLSGPWDLCYLIVIRIYFLGKFLVFGNILFFLGGWGGAAGAGGGGELGPKMDQNHQLWVRPISA